MRVENMTSPGSQETMFVVFDKECPIGFITKYKNTRTETHPYKAFWYTVRPIGGKMAEYTMLDVFYGKDGKKRALAAIKNKHTG